MLTRSAHAAHAPLAKYFVAVVLATAQGALFIFGQCDDRLAVG
jgi:hypothetical protein